MTSLDLAPQIAGAPPAVFIASLPGAPPVPVAGARSELLPPVKLTGRASVDVEEGLVAEAGVAEAPRPPVLVFPRSAAPAPLAPPAPPLPRPKPRPSPPRPAAVSSPATAPATVPAPATEPSRPRIELVDDGEFRFPLDFRPPSWHVAPRAFGGRRAHGRRKHAGCDLYAPVGTPVHAIADGVLWTAGGFYEGTDAVAVRHDRYLVRYGEVFARSCPFKPGQKIRKGDVVGRVGKMPDNPPMLHFEMYGNPQSSERLTNLGRPPYLRRADLIDPTRLLDEWVQRVPR